MDNPRIDNIIKMIANDGRPNHDTALSLRPCQMVEVNEFGEMSPWYSDIDVVKNDIVIIAKTTKMNEDLFNLLMQVAKDGTEATVIYTSIGYSQPIVASDDVYTLCDVLELINQ